MNNVYHLVIPLQMINDTPVLLITYRRSKNIAERLDKLISLGFKKHQANIACEKLIKKNDFEGNLEQIIKKALKYLMN